MPDMHKCTKKNTKQVLPPTHFHCPKLSQHDLLIWQKLTHHEGLWSECSFQPPQESAVQSSAEKRRLEEERWDENAVLKTETECRGRCKERGRKKRMKERKTNNREGKYARQKDAMQETRWLKSTSFINWGSFKGTWLQVTKNYTTTVVHYVKLKQRLYKSKSTLKESWIEIYGTLL